MLKLLTSLVMKVKALAYNQGLIADYIVEYGTEGNWKYEKWASGKAICWRHAVHNTKIIDPVSSYWYISPSLTTYFPSGLFIEMPNCFIMNSGVNGADVMNIVATTKDYVKTRINYPVSYSHTIDWGFNIFVVGLWKTYGGGVIKFLHYLGGTYYAATSK